MTLSTWIAVLAALVLSLASPFAVRPLLKKLSSFDVPNSRSSHVENVLRGGGIAPLVGILVGVAIVAAQSGQPQSKDLPRLIIIFVAAAAVGGLGLVEDLRGVPVALRAGLQFAIGGAASAALVILTGVPWWWIPVATVFFVAYTNATNFMDGIDSISSVHGLTVGAVFAIVGGLSHSSWLVSVGLVVAVSFFAFLPWNLGANRIFLGDVGSYLLGGTVAIAFIAAGASGISLLALVGPLAIYLADTGATLARRAARGERWQDAHRSHVYQRLVIAGLSHVQVSTIVAFASVISAGFGLFALSNSAGGSLIAGVGILLTAAAYLSLPLFFVGARVVSEPFVIRGKGE